MKLTILCLGIFSLSLLAERPNNPCSTSLNNGISTMNRFIVTMETSNKIAGNVTDDLPGYFETINGVSDALNGLTSMVDERTSHSAMIGYILYATLGAVPVVVVGYLTVTFCQFVKGKLIDPKRSELL